MNKRLRHNLRRAFKGLPRMDELIGASVAGRERKDWYQQAHKAIKELYPIDYPVFIAILSATSPRQSVDLNLRMTQDIFSAWDKANRPLKGRVFNKICRISDLKARRLNVARALRGEDLSGYKVRAFKDNLSGNLDAVTIDTWMLTFAGLETNRFFEKKAANMAYQHRIKQAAKRLKWRPAEVQAAIWCYTYAKVNKIDIAEVPNYVKKKEVAI